MDGSSYNEIVETIMGERDELQPPKVFLVIQTAVDFVLPQRPYIEKEEGGGKNRNCELPVGFHGSAS